MCRHDSGLPQVLCYLGVLLAIALGLQHVREPGNACLSAERVSDSFETGVSQTGCARLACSVPEGCERGVWGGGSGVCQVPLAVRTVCTWDLLHCCTWGKGVADLEEFHWQYRNWAGRRGPECQPPWLAVTSDFA